MIAVGIDPDSTGAVVAIRSSTGIPVYFDAGGLFEVVDALRTIKAMAADGEDIFVILEAPNPYRGSGKKKAGDSTTEGAEESSSSGAYFVTYKQYRYLGQIEGVMAMLGMSWKPTVARSWKSKVLPGAAGRERPVQKQLAMDEARRLYQSSRPWITLKKHAARAEALLMAHLARRGGV